MQGEVSQQDQQITNPAAHEPIADEMEMSARLPQLQGANFMTSVRR